MNFKKKKINNIKIKTFFKKSKGKYLNSLNVGFYGFQHIEFIYNCLNKLIQKNGRVIRLLFHVHISKKPIKILMRKGKISFFLCKQRVVNQNKFLISK